TALAQREPPETAIQQTQGGSGGKRCPQPPGRQQSAQRRTQYKAQSERGTDQTKILRTGGFVCADIGNVRGSRGKTRAGNPRNDAAYKQPAIGGSPRQYQIINTEPQ